MALTPLHSAGIVGMWEVENVGRVGIEWYYTGRQSLEENPYRTISEPYMILGLLAEKQFGRIRLFVNGEKTSPVCARHDGIRCFARPEPQMADGPSMLGRRSKVATSTEASAFAFDARGQCQPYDRQYMPGLVALIRQRLATHLHLDTMRCARRTMDDASLCLHDESSRHRPARWRRAWRRGQARGTPIV